MNHDLWVKLRKVLLFFFWFHKVLWTLEGFFNALQILMETNNENTIKISAVLSATDQLCVRLGHRLWPTVLAYKSYTTTSTPTTTNNELTSIIKSAPIYGDVYQKTIKKRSVNVNQKLNNGGQVEVRFFIDASKLFNRSSSLSLCLWVQIIKH